MANYFTLTLDTVGPSNPQISFPGAYTNTQLVTVTISTNDPDTTGYQMLIWGDVDITYDVNVQDTEAASQWIVYQTSYQVKLSAGDGTKNIYLKIRDDVLNVSAQASDSIILDTVAPVVVITLAPSVSKISKIAPKDSVSFKWQADSDFAEYIVAVVPTSDSDHTAGTVIPTTGGSENTSGSSGTANTEITTVIKGADLENASPGDGQKIIKIFVRDLADNWSN